MKSKGQGGMERYDADQVGLILERAVELQSREGAGSSRRMSLEEVEAIAGEAGIDVALVRRAAGELGRPQPQTQTHHRLLGGPAALQFEMRLAGELSPECFDDVLHEVHLALKEPGTSTRSARSLGWNTIVAQGQPGRRISVSISVARGETAILVDERLGPLIGSLFGGVLGGVGGGGMGLIALPLVFAPLLTPVFIGGWLGGSYLLARTLYARRVARRSQELQALLGRIIGVCEDELASALSLRASSADPSGRASSLPEAR